MKIIIQNASKEFVDGLIKKHPGKINIIKQNNRACDDRKEKRQDKIINVLYGLGQEVVRLEALYKSLRIRGYSLTRKTLTRDLKELEQRKLVKLNVIGGGAEGKYTLVYKNE